MITTTEVAERLNVSKRTVIRLIEDKKLPAYRFGKDYRIDENDLKEFIKKSKTVND